MQTQNDPVLVENAIGDVVVAYPHDVIGGGVIDGEAVIFEIVDRLKVVSKLEALSVRDILDIFTAVIDLDVASMLEVLKALEVLRVPEAIDEIEEFPEGRGHAELLMASRENSGSCWTWKAFHRSL